MGAATEVSAAGGCVRYPQYSSAKRWIFGCWNTRSSSHVFVENPGTTDVFRGGLLGRTYSRDLLLPVNRKNKPCRAKSLPQTAWDRESTVSYRTGSSQLLRRGAVVPRRNVGCPSTPLSVQSIQAWQAQQRCCSKQHNTRRGINMTTASDPSLHQRGTRGPSRKSSVSHVRHAGALLRTRDCTPFLLRALTRTALEAIKQQLTRQINEIHERASTVRTTT